MKNKIVNINEFKETLKNFGIVEPEPLSDTEMEDLQKKYYGDPDKVGYKQLNGSDTINYADVVRIIFDEKCINKMYIEEYDDLPTFDDVLNIAKENGYKNGVILLIAENPLHGEIYEYGNYGHVWVEHGVTKGHS